MGRAFAERFARAGMKVVLADVEAPRLDEAVDSIVATGAEAIGVNFGCCRLKNWVRKAKEICSWSWRSRN